MIVGVSGQVVAISEGTCCRGLVKMVVVVVEVVVEAAAVVVEVVVEAAAVVVEVVVEVAAVVV